MLVISKSDIENIFSMKEAIEADKEASRMYTEGGTTVPLRTNIDAKNGQNLFMPAYVSELNTTGIKIVSVFPNNPSLGKPAVPAQMVLLDGETGEVCAMIDGTYLTQLRTGAVQGAATDYLACADAKEAVLIGAGGQAESQLEAMLVVRDLDRVGVVDLNREFAEKFVARMNEKFASYNTEIYLVEDVDAAISNADIITAVTTSKRPVFDGSLVKPGAHVNGVGAYTSEMKEVPVEAIAKADVVVVDTFDGVFAEAGDVLSALEQNLKTKEDFVEMGTLALDGSKGRQSDDQITFFKSVGTAVLDVVVAHKIYEKARELGIGTEI